MHKSLNVYVLEIAPARDLAFEADTAIQAAAFARAPWFLDAVDNFLEGTGKCSVAIGTQHIRAATPIEEHIYDNLREEFEGLTRQFLVADLSGFTERHAAGPATAV